MPSGFRLSLWVGHRAQSGPCSYGGAGTSLLGHLGMKQNGDETARYGNNSNASSVVGKVATAQLNREGVEAIWLLHLSATQAHVDGYAHAAKLVLEIADSAEPLWLAKAQHGVSGRQGSGRITLPASSEGPEPQGEHSHGSGGVSKRSKPPTTLLRDPPSLPH